MLVAVSTIKYLKCYSVFIKEKFKKQIKILIAKLTTSIQSPAKKTDNLKLIKIFPYFPTFHLYLSLTV